MKMSASTSRREPIVWKHDESKGRIVISEAALAAAKDDAVTHRMLRDLGDFTKLFGLNMLITELGDGVISISPVPDLTDDQRSILEARASGAGYSVVIRNGA